MELAERKKKILSAVIESYINTGEPIGSKALINETGLDEFQRCRVTDTTSTI